MAKRSQNWGRVGCGVKVGGWVVVRNHTSHAFQISKKNTVDDIL